jgi:hypothetical protein
MRSAFLALAALLVLAAPAGHPGSAHAATMNASTSNLSSVFGSAQAGDTILLAAGDYGAWSGGSKSGMVTLRPQSGATVTMRPNFNGAANLTLDGMTIGGASIAGRSSNIRIVNSRFTSSSTVDGSSMANANIVFDHDTFDGIDACDSCYEGRLTVRGSGGATTTPVGVSITNSHFGSAGESDGVQIIGNAYGVKIGPGNEFEGIKQGSYQRHVDSIQLYGSSHTQIVGNYFHDNDTILMAPDGGTAENVANNVMIGGGAYRPAVQFGHHDGSTFTHNTIKNIDINTYVNSGDPEPNRNMVVRDNLAVNASLNGSGCSGCTVSYNLFTKGATGSNAQTATPVFTGGSAPTTYAGWALKSGSPGKGNASDGSDRGVNVGTSPSTTPPGAPAPGTTTPGGGSTTPGTTGTTNGPNGAPSTLTAGDASNPAALAGAIGIRWSYKPSKPRVGTRIVLVAPKTKAGGRKCVWTIARGVTRRGCTIAVRFKKAGVKRITVRITDRSGAVVRGTRELRVVRRGISAKRS